MIVRGAIKKFFDGYIFLRKLKGKRVGVRVKERSKMQDQEVRVESPIFLFKYRVVLAFYVYE